MVKKVLLILITMAILTGGVGCMSTKKKLSAEEKKAKVMEYLKNKYDEEFVGLSYSLSGWGEGSDVMSLIPKSKVGQKTLKFDVWGTLRKDGTYAMRDSYYWMLIKPEYEATLAGIIKDVYKEFKQEVYIDGKVFADGLNKNTKVSDIYDVDPEFSTSTNVFVKMSSTDGGDVSEGLKKIAAKMKEKKLPGEVDIFVIFDDKFEEMNHEILNEEEEIKKKFIYKNSYWCIYVDNVDGQLEISEVKCYG